MELGTSTLRVRCKACTQFGYWISTIPTMDYLTMHVGERLNEKEFELEPTQLSMDWQSSTYMHLYHPWLSRLGT